MPTIQEARKDVEAQMVLVRSGSKGKVVAPQAAGRPFPQFCKEGSSSYCCIRAK